MIVIGVDGGTTKTIALVADETGHILSAARGAGSNWIHEDVTIPMTVVIDVVRDALAQAGIRGEDVGAGVFALAGADWPEDHVRRAAVLSQAGLSQKVIVKNDCFGGLRAGTDRPYGMVLAAGTGMNAAVITPSGEEWAYGYYETFGGAGTIAQQVYEAVLRAEDGRNQATCLTAMVLNRLGFNTVEALLRARVANQISRRRFLSLSSLAFEAAMARDPVAVQIIVCQGQGLAEYATAMARRFGMQDLEFDVVLAGSVFKGVGPLLVDTIRQEIHKTVPYANIVRARFEPVVGSVLLALDAVEIKMNPGIYNNLQESVPGEEFFSTVNSEGLRPVQPGIEEEEA